MGGIISWPYYGGNAVDKFCFDVLTYQPSPTLIVPLSVMLFDCISISAYVFYTLSLFQQHRSAMLGKLDPDRCTLPSYVGWVQIHLLASALLTFGLIFSMISIWVAVLMVGLFTIVMETFVWTTILMGHMSDIGEGQWKKAVKYGLLIGFTSFPLSFVWWLPAPAFLGYDQSNHSPWNQHATATSGHSLVDTFSDPIALLTTLAGGESSDHFHYPEPISTFERLHMPLYYLALAVTVVKLFTIAFLIFCNYAHSHPKFRSFVPGFMNGTRQSIRWILFLGLINFINQFSYVLNHLIDIYATSCNSIIGIVSGTVYPFLLVHFCKQDTMFWRKVGVITGQNKYTRLLFQSLSNDWRIEYKDVVKDKILGRGGSGEVHLGRWKDSKVAIKTLYITALDEFELEEFVNEVTMLRQLHHPHIVMFLGAVVQAPHFMMITEYMARGSLADVLGAWGKNKGKKRKKLTWKLKLKFAREAALGMDYLHSLSPPVMHRDLKSPNILVGKDYTAKIGDLGVSKLRDDTKTLTLVGTPFWNAPEVLQRSFYSEQADIFSYGVVLREIAAEAFPYEGLRPMQVVMMVSEEGYRDPIPEDCPEAFADLIQKAWAQEPSDRPSFAEIIQELRQIEHSMFPNTSSASSSSSSFTDSFTSTDSGSYSELTPSFPSLN